MKTEYLLHAEVERVLMLLTPSNRRVFRVCLHTGLRVSDVLALTPEQVKPKIWVTESKTKKRKFVGFPEDLRVELLENAGKYYVFPNARDPKRHRTRQAVWKDVKRAAKAFRLPQNVGIHSARKVYAVELMQKYGDISKVRKALNHSSDGVTMIYALADMSLQKKLQKRKKMK